MVKKKITALLLTIITISLGIAYYYYPDVYVGKLFSTSLSLVILTVIFRLFIQETIHKKVKEARTRYSLNKITSIFYVTLFIIIALRIWVVNPQALLVSYGLVAAGVAIALQDFFKNIAGSAIILATGIYHVGDRIEISGKHGDVIDINIFYTTLMEIREWVDGDLATGRIVVVPNGAVISTPVHNYTKEHDFIWDEIKIPLTYTSDWKYAQKKLFEIVKKETKQVVLQAEKEIAQLGEKYFVSKRSLEPTIFVSITDNWIAMHIRYVTKVGERRQMKSKLSQLILEEIQKTKKVHIGSTTLDIVGFPK